MHVSTVKDSIVLHLAFEKQGGIDWYAFWGGKKKRKKIRDSYGNSYFRFPL